MSKRPKVIIFLYNRLFDPLIQSNFWLYIDDFFQNSNPYNFHLITYEDRDFPMSNQEIKILDRYKEMGLTHSFIYYHRGQSLKNKFLDLSFGFWEVFKLRFRGYNHIITLGSISATYAYLYSITLNIKQFLYQFEPHSEYALDNKMWSKNSKQYKISHFLEKRVALNAKVIASGTKFMGERVKDVWKSKATFIRIPTVANDKKFIFDRDKREMMRKNLGVDNDKWLLYYPGKFGDLYYKEEFALMYKWIREVDDRFHLLIVTPHSDEEVEEIFDSVGVEREDYIIAHSSYDEIENYHFASDFAIISVAQGESKKFISNIKVGEYLCAGLPFLINNGVSEDYLYAIEKNVGVVVDGFIEDEIKKSVPKIVKYLEADRDRLRNHCREIGLDYRGFKSLNPKFKKALEVLVDGE